MKQLRSNRSVHVVHESNNVLDAILLQGLLLRFLFLLQKIKKSFHSIGLLIFFENKHQQQLTSIKALEIVRTHP